MRTSVWSTIAAARCSETNHQPHQSMKKPRRDGATLQIMCVTIRPIITMIGTPSNQRRTGIARSDLLIPGGSLFNKKVC